MKYILTDEQGGVLGPFTTAEKVDNGYICDNESYQTAVTGNIILSEVSDDYEHPNLPVYPEQMPPIKHFQPTIETVVTDAPVEPVVEPTIEGAV